MELRSAVAPGTTLIIVLVSGLGCGDSAPSQSREQRFEQIAQLQCHITCGQDPWSCGLSNDEDEQVSQASCVQHWVEQQTTLLEGADESCVDAWLDFTECSGKNLRRAGDEAVADPCAKLEKRTSAACSDQICFVPLEQPDPGCTP